MKNLAYYLNLPYKIEITKIPSESGGGYCAIMPEFKDKALFWGDGKTREEALKELEVAFEFTIETMLENGDYIPEPTDDTRIRVNLTIPKSVLAAIDAVTKNRSAWITDLAKKALAI